jgi:uncharacterized protein (DUF1697 family)
MATNLSNINLFSYAAFLRGINVGGKRQIKMEALQIAFQSWGLENVATILNSGNILFDAHSNDALEVKQIITTGIQSNFGFDADVFVRTIEDLKTLAARDPFKGYSESTLMKLYVTLLNQKVLLKIAIPYQSPGKELKILLVTDKELFSVVSLTPRFGTTQMMTFLEKEFGSELTTRNWNTIIKILDLYQKRHP